MEAPVNILREAREARGLTLDQLEAELRINRKFLLALEEGRYDALPTPVHVRGYLRNYARRLTIDAQPLLDRYETALKAGGKLPPAQATVSDALPTGPTVRSADGQFFNPVNVEINPDRAGTPNTEALVRIIIIIALLVAIGLVASRLLLTDERRVNIGEAFTSLVNPQQVPSAAEIDVNQLIEEAAIESSDSLSGTLPLETGRNAFSDPDQPTPIPPLRDPGPLEFINLRLDITERTWLQVTVDGSVQFEGQAASGDVLEFQTASQSVVLKTGNAIAIFVTINDQELGRLGERAEVVDMTWQTGQ